MQTLGGLIPDDLLPKVAGYITDDPEPYRIALAFAKGSELRRRAVLEALDFRVTFREKDRRFFQDMISLFDDTIQHISLTDVVDDMFLDTIPKLPQLKTASILSTDLQLMFIRDKPSLTSLEIKVSNVQDFLWLPAVFSPLESLTNLKLDVSNCGDPSQVLQETIAKSCPKVEKLEIVGNPVYQYKHMVMNLPALISLTCCNGVRMFPQMDTLAKIEEVHLPEEGHMRNAEYLGRAVRTLHLYVTKNATEIAKLKHCPNLKQLLVAVENGAENALLGNTENLESLDLRWGYPTNWVLPLQRGEIRDEDIYYEPDGNTLIELVRTSPKLRHLLLERALIPTPILENIFEVIGDRLEQFGVHMTGQDEDVTIRLQTVLRFLAKYCPNIKCLLLMGRGVETRATCEQIRRCCKAVSFTRNRCPKLEVGTIQTFIKSIIPIRKKRPRSRFMQVSEDLGY